MHYSTVHVQDGIDRTLERAPKYEVRCTDLVSNEESTEGEVIIDRVERSYEFRECGSRRELFGELKERLSL